MKSFSFVSLQASTIQQCVACAQRILLDHPLALPHRHE
jgi:hypothetical protein